MANINNYLRQHQGILESTTSINKIIKEKNIEENARGLALEINKLAGKLKIHLTTEDKYLYPRLKSNNSTKNIAVKFEGEMGHIADTVNSFKEKYNIAPKVEENPSTFRTEALSLIKTIEYRIHKEEKELYIHITEA